MGICNSLFISRVVSSSMAAVSRPDNVRRCSVRANSCWRRALTCCRKSLIVSTTLSECTQRSKVRTSSAIIACTCSTSCRRRRIPSLTPACRSSRLYRYTPGRSITAGSISRGSAISISSIERPARRCMTSCITSRVITTCGAVVELITTSASTSELLSSAKERCVAPKR